MSDAALRLSGRIRLLACGIVLLAAGCGGSGNDHDSTPSAGQSNTPASSSSGSGGSSSGGSAAQQSTNWAGYEQTGGAGSFTKVSGSWTVPEVSCPSGASTQNSTWTGIGGSSAADQTLIQAGTEQDCSGGPSYYAWWEALPAPSAQAGGGPLSSATYNVKPGDQITVTVDGSAVTLWTITIHNATQNWTFTQQLPYANSGDSAEWISEQPTSVGTGGTGLSNFGKVSFSNLAANGANAQLTQSQSIELIDSTGKVLASPSAPGSGGNSFDVCYGAGACQ